MLESLAVLSCLFLPVGILDWFHWSHDKCVVIGWLCKPYLIACMTLDCKDICDWLNLTVRLSYG